MSAALLAAAAIVAPLILLRGRAIRRYFAIVIGGTLTFALLAAAGRPLRVAFDPYLVAVSFGFLPRFCGGSWFSSMCRSTSSFVTPPGTKILIMIAAG